MKNSEKEATKTKVNMGLKIIDKILTYL